MASRAAGYDINKLPPDNWVAPSYSPTGIRTFTDYTPPTRFIGLQPCRLVDTRGNGAPIQGGAFSANESRRWDLRGLCGLPITADVVSLNIAVTNTQAHPYGFVKVWPEGAGEPNVSTLNWSSAGETVSNAAIVPISNLFGFIGTITLKTGNAGADVIVDTNGYFDDRPDSGTFENIVETGVAISGVSHGTGAGTFGVQGRVTDEGFHVAGVKGVAGGGYSVVACCLAAGVRGEAAAFGLLGISPGTGIGGFNIDVNGNIQNGGRIGFGGVAGVYFLNGLAGTGTKSFVEPHPTDASRVIKYVAIEGPEAGVYFRGRARASAGLATIEVPESFRMVAAEDSLSIQITAIGETANFAVQEVGLDRIVVKATRDVEFFYMVNGVRKAYPTWDPIQPNMGEFVPETPDARLPAYLSEDERRRLVDNGTYNPDGSVNVRTARRLGWDRIWETRTPTGRSPN
jgi:hypothetical protein